MRKPDTADMLGVLAYLVTKYADGRVEVPVSEMSSGRFALSACFACDGGDGGDGDKTTYLCVEASVETTKDPSLKARLN